MKLTFTKANDTLIYVTQQDGDLVSTLYLSDKTMKWSICSMSGLFSEPDNLRQIADKLDELNGVTE